MSPRGQTQQRVSGRHEDEVRERVMGPERGVQCPWPPLVTRLGEQGQGTQSGARNSAPFPLQLPSPPPFPSFPVHSHSCLPSSYLHFFFSSPLLLLLHFFLFFSSFFLSFCFGVSPSVPEIVIRQNESSLQYPASETDAVPERQDNPETLAGSALR